MKKTNPKRDRYAFVTTRVISELEQGIVPWKQSWNCAKHTCCLEFRPRSSAGIEDLNVTKCFGVCSGNAATLLLTSTVNCSNVYDRMPDKPQILSRGKVAFYHPDFDIVNMPPLKCFDSNDNYYGMLFHQLIHSTGHRTRLNRRGLSEMSEFGSKLYSLEELVADIGENYLRTLVKINPDSTITTGYIANWINQFRANEKFIVQAHTLAQNAVGYILNRNFKI